MKNCVVLEDTDEHDISCNWKNNPLQDITNVNAEKIKAIDFLRCNERKDRRTCLQIFESSTNRNKVIISKEMNDKRKTWKGMLDVQVKNCVKNARIKNNAIFRMSTLVDGPRFFPFLHTI